MTRLRGRAARGQRVHGTQPHGHWQTTTMISSIRFDGSTACMTINGATDAEVFRTYVERVLAPTLRAGDIVIMDNLAAHKCPQTEALIMARGAEVRYLPPYSPDLNPIEKMWSKVKNILRSAAARTLTELETAIAAALAKVTGQDARAWWVSCGYNII